MLIKIKNELFLKKELPNGSNQLEYDHDTFEIFQLGRSTLNTFLLQIFLGKIQINKTI